MLDDRAIRLRRRPRLRRVPHRAPRSCGGPAATQGEAGEQQERRGGPGAGVWRQPWLLLSLPPPAVSLLLSVAVDEAVALSSVGAEPPVTVSPREAAVQAAGR